MERELSLNQVAMAILLNVYSLYSI
jgi:hypothetical protein